MTGLIATSPPESQAASVRGLRRDLAAAADDQLLRVVALVDGLSDRGSADDLIAPVRRRLRELRPDRKLRFGRLLFLPLDKLIVPSGEWRGRDGLVPRTAVAVFAAEIQASLRRTGHSEAVAQIDRILATVRSAETEIVNRAGALLWPLAGAALSRLIEAAPPPAWGRAGLPEAAFHSLGKSLAAVLGAAAPLRALAERRGSAAERDEALAKLLRDAECHGGQAWGMLLSLILLECPDSQTPVEAAALAASRADRAFRTASMAAIDTALGTVEAGSTDARAPLSNHAADELALQISLLDRLGALQGDKALQKRLADLRSRLHETCASRFSAELRDDFPAGVKALAETQEPSDAEIDALEATVRCLRRFETEARRLGGGAQYDAELKTASAMVAAMRELDLADRARLVELLAGPEAGLGVLRDAN